MTTYYAYEPVNQPQLPVWDTWWMESDGCSPRHVYFYNTWTATPPAPGPPKTYTPVSSYTWRLPNQSGLRKTGSGPTYRFTRHSVGRVTTKQHLIRIKKGLRGLCRWYQYGKVSKIGGTCTPQVTNLVASGPCYTTYNEVSRDFPYYGTFVRTDLNEGEVSQSLDELRNELISEAATAYDVLTDISQLGDIPRLINSIVKDLTWILRSLRSRFGRNAMRAAYSLNILDLLRHPDRVLRKLGDEWMAYRYGIMPLVYSYRDAMKNLNRGQDVKTRKSRSIFPYESGETLPPSNIRYWVKDVKGSVVIRGEVFQNFKSDEAARLSGFGVNPLVTAWELIPYSFVVDWFVDVGSFLSACASSTFSQESWACLSRRDNFTKKTYLHLGNEDQSIVIDNAWPTGWWGSNYPPNLPNQVISNPAGDYIYEEVVVDAYERWPISLSAVTPSFHPSLSWRRLVDGAVLSNNFLGRFIRSFR